MPHLTKRLVLIVLAGVIAALVVVMGSKWRAATMMGGQKTAEPFRIAGNLYYVGANDVTSFLLTGPEGHVLIDGGYPGTAPMIIESIAKLGFKITDVKVLLNSHAHFDHAGGLAELQQASGAELWISEGDADIIAAGGAGDPTIEVLPMKALVSLGIVKFPPPRVDHRFQDGDTLRLGPIELTAHVTAGHTPGCTSWSFPVRDGDRQLLVVSICSLKLPPVSLVEPETYPGIRANFERSFSTLRSLPADIFLTAHAREFGRWRKFQQRATAKDPVEPFIDRAGYLRVIDRHEKEFRRVLADQQRNPPSRIERWLGLVAF